MYILRKLPFHDLNLELYNGLYHKSAHASPFLSLSWLEAISHSSYGYKLKFLEISEHNVVVGFMPYFERWFGLIKVCNVWGGYGGYVSDANLNLNKINSLSIMKQYKYNERTLSLFSLFKTKSLSTWTKSVDASYDDVFSSLHKKTKNQIRKANKSNITYVNVNTPTLAKECFDVYQLLIEKHNIATPLSIDTFISLAKYNDLDFIATLINGKVIAYSVFLYSKTECFYWLNASDSNYASLNATSGMLNKVIEKLCKSNIKILNFGAVPQDNTGLQHFKSRWGAVEKKYYCEVGVTI